jgi:DHA1 family bicyclomycin/chloramphenicol resistance-like MFS transporter
LAQGIAAASGPVIARAIVRDSYHGNKAAQVMSMLGAAMAVIPLIAPTIGAWVIVWFHWRATFVALAVFGVLILFGLRSFKESAPAIGQGSIRLLPVLKLFSACLSNRQFIGFQICGTATYAAILAYLSTVAYFMRDVFALPTAYFGYAFAASVSGFMAGALLCSRLVMYLGMHRVMTLGLILSLLAAISQRALAPAGLDNAWGLAVSSCLIFFGIGLTSANAAMGAVSLFPKSAGAASAVYGFLHSVIAALVGFLAGIYYDGSLIPTANIMLVCGVIGLLGLPLTTEPPSRSAST